VSRETVGDLSNTQRSTEGMLGAAQVNDDEVTTPLKKFSGKKACEPREPATASGQIFQTRKEGVTRVQR
jgi:hypothetical protein